MVSFIWANGGNPGKWPVHIIVLPYFCTVKALNLLFECFLWLRYFTAFKVLKLVRHGAQDLSVLLMVSTGTFGIFFTHFYDSQLWFFELQSHASPVWIWIIFHCCKEKLSGSDKKTTVKFLWVFINPHPLTGDLELFLPHSLGGFWGSAKGSAAHINFFWRCVFVRFEFLDIKKNIILSS